MSTRRKSLNGSASRAAQDSGGRGRAEGTAMEPSADVDETRAKWVQDRQEELDRVFDAHDSLVREAFHLEKFVSLLSYDPKVAKDDRSDVFQRFQAQYDLVDHTSSAGPSRRTTRRAHTERLQGLKTHPPGSPPVTTNRRGRKTESDSYAAFWDIKAEAKSKEKHAHDEVQEDVPHALSISQHGHTRKGKAKDTWGDAVPVTPIARSKSTKTVSILDDQAPPLDAQGIVPPRKKRKTIADSKDANSPQSSRHSLRSAASMPDISISTADAVVPALSSRVPNGPSLQHEPTEPQPSPVKHPIRSVKLIVRKYPTILTNPLQKPKPPLFNGSIDALLSSFTYRNDHEVGSDELDADIATELALWKRVDPLRRQGRLLERMSYDFKDPPPQDAWASIVAQIERPGPKVVDGREMAANVAGKVRKYWEGENRAEEARMRGIARSAMQMVVAQWRKAVYHVREQARLEREAEERRRGQEHLNAILDQSGQILAVQSHDLARDSRSRSRSVSTHDYDFDRSDHESDDEGTARDDEPDLDEESSDSESSAEDEGISMLVPDLEGVSDAGRPARSVSMDLDAPTSEGGRNSPIEDNLEGDTQDIGLGDDASSSPGPSLSVRYAERGPVPMDVDRLEELLGSPALKPGLGAGDAHHSKPPAFGISGQGISAESQNIRLNGATPSDNLATPASPSVLDTVDTDSPHPSTVTDGEGVQETPDVYTGDATHAGDDDVAEDDVEDDASIPYYLRPYAVAPVEWDREAKVKPPLLLRGTLRPYQQAGLEWLASIHTRDLNAILADEMGLGKTIQTIALLAHLACDRGIWGPHLIIVPTSVLLNWEMEFKKFLPGFKVLSYHGNAKQRKELRQGWNNKYHFNVCITSYNLASRDSHVFKRKRWYYMILDEAHMIKNFKSQRWNILLLFRSFRRLLLTGTPLQNNLTELWALLQFLLSGQDFANLKEFAEWFANPLEKAIELGAIDNETQQRVSKLHTMLRPYLLRRLKRDVEKELPQKYEHLVMCPLSKRQRFLYDEFMARAETRHDLQSGVYQKIANILMQLRKVVNHPDLFEVRPIVTSFAMQRSAVADYEIKELLVRRRLLAQSDEEQLNLDFLGLRFLGDVGMSEIAAGETRRLDGTHRLPMITEVPGEPPPRDTRTIAGFRQYRAYQERAAAIARWSQIGYINRLRCARMPVYSAEALSVAQRMYSPLVPLGVDARPALYLSTPDIAQSMVQSYSARAEEMAPYVDRFAFATPAVVARDLPRIALSSFPPATLESIKHPEFDAPLHRASVKLQIAFPDPSLLQYDCGKLQVLAKLLRERKAGGHRCLIFTQMTRILDILEIFLNLHGYLYLRLDGATKIEDRQYITERFNSDPRVFCFISSSRSGGVGINLTGADTVIFYDSDFNPQMDRQCEDRAHRIGQIRDVHIYRFISQHTVEEALLRKANQKRSLDDLVIQKGEFDWRTLFVDANESALTRALGEFEDVEDAQAARVAAQEEMLLEDEDAQDFGREGLGAGTGTVAPASGAESEQQVRPEAQRVGDVPDIDRPADDDLLARSVAEGDEGAGIQGEEGEEEGEEGEEEGRTIDDYMLDFVHLDQEFFSTADWNV